MSWSGAAPCQCCSPGPATTVSPARSCRTGPPADWTRPTPSSTCSTWPPGWACHAVRAPGENVTRSVRTAVPGRVASSSIQTCPVNQSAGPAALTRDVAGLNSICSPVRRWTPAPRPRLARGRGTPEPGQGPRGQAGQVAALPGQMRLVGVAGQGGQPGQVVQGPARVDPGHDPAETQHAAQQHRAVAHRGHAPAVQLALADAQLPGDLRDPGAGPAE